MKVYNLMYDGEHQIIEAPSLGDAVKAWHAHMLVDQAPHWDGTEEPESITLINEEAVIHFRTLLDNKIGEQIDRKFIFSASCREHDHTYDENHAMVFTAKDAALVPMLRYYREHCERIGALPRQLIALDLLIERVIRYQAMNPERVKVPDVDDSDKAEHIVAPNVAFTAS